jgi:hypothetical protein
LFLFPLHSWLCTISLSALQGLKVVGLRDRNQPAISKMVSFHLLTSSGVSCLHCMIRYMLFIESSTKDYKGQRTHYVWKRVSRPTIVCFNIEMCNRTPSGIELFIDILGSVSQNTQCSCQTLEDAPNHFLRHWGFIRVFSAFEVLPPATRNGTECTYS